jgi:hypothetical protein
MIHFTLITAPSRHKRSAKAAMVEALRHYPAIRQIQKRRYAVKLVFSGRWNNKDGSPKRRDPDSVVIVILDAIAEAAGIDDKFLNRVVSWHTVEADRETVSVTLAPI